MSERNIIDTVINNILQDRKLYGDSIKWANWEAKFTLFTCIYCAQQHGKIFDISILENKTEVNAHKRCQCEYVPMRTKIMGTATDQGSSGVDVYLSKYWKLPDYYVTKEAAKSAGWVSWKGRVTVDIRTRCHLLFLVLFAPASLARSYLASQGKHQNHTKISA